MAGSATDVVECPGTGVIRSRNIQQLAEVTDVARGILGKNRFKKKKFVKANATPGVSWPFPQKFSPFG